MTCKLTFPRKEIQKLVVAATASPSLEPSYGNLDPTIPKLTEPHLTLVRDDGVYLLPHLRKGIIKFDEGETYETIGLISWAREADPRKNRETAYEYGRRVFGGDDGAMDLPCSLFRAAFLDNPGDVVMILREETVEVTA